jgi:hypothetical protein
MKKKCRDSNEKYSLGPWMTSLSGTCADDVPCRWEIIETKTGGVIAETNDSTDYSNARLIAAAPNLLRALQDLLGDHKRMFAEAHPHSTIEWEECVEVQQALAAINKATN